MGPASPDDPNETVTPAEVPEQRYPPGLTTAGVDNATALAAAHAAGVRNRSLTLGYLERVTLPNGTDVSRRESRLVLGPGWTRLVGSTNRTGARAAPFRATVFVNRSGLFSRQYRDGELRYDRDDSSPGPPTRLVVGPVAELLESFDRPTVQQVSEEPIRFRVQGAVRDPERALRFEPTGPTTLVAVVDGEGVVRRLQVSHETDSPRTARADAPARFVERIRLRGLGETTVERPAWVADAAAAIRADRPAGLGDDRVADPHALIESHRATLVGEQVQVNRELRAPDDAGEPQGRLLRRERALVGGERTTFYRSVEGGTGTGDRAVWSNRTVSVTERFVDGTARYSAGSPAAFSVTGAVGPPGRELGHVLAGLGEVRISYENRRYVVAADSVADPGQVVFGDSDRADRVANVSAEVRIDRDGAVESVRIEYRTVGNGTRVVERLDYEGFRSGTVPKPSWVDVTLDGRETAG